LTSVSEHFAEFRSEIPPCQGILGETSLLKFTHVTDELGENEEEEVA
jgi:hypothetical protein